MSGTRLPLVAVAVAVALLPPGKCCPKTPVHVPPHSLPQIPSNLFLPAAGEQTEEEKLLQQENSRNV